MINEFGIFVEVDIYGVWLKMLIDIGVLLMLILKRVYDIILVEKCLVLEESGQKVLNVSGNLFFLYGKVEYYIKIGKIEVFILVMVIDVMVDGIFGLDFLKKGKGIIDFNFNII